MTTQPAYKIWKKTFTSEHLHDLFYEKIAQRTSVGLDWVTSQQFREQLDLEIDIILRKSSDLTYRFTHYREVLLSKGRDKLPRCISIPTMRDKLVLAALNELLVTTYGNAIVTPMPQIIISDLICCINSKKYDTFIKIDIKRFYSSINHDILMKIIQKTIRKPQILWLLRNAIKTETIPANMHSNPKARDVGVPEGLSISNSLASIYMLEIDECFLSQGYKLKYWRYVDDIIILTNSKDAESISSLLESKLKQIKLEIHQFDQDDKCSFGQIKTGFQYLGYVFRDGLVTVRSKSIENFERNLETLFRTYKHSLNQNDEYIEWKINLKITGFILENNKYGWTFFYSQITDISCLVHLDWLISKFKKRYKVSNAVHFKKFVRAYHEITKALHKTKYIPNLDTMGINEKRKIVKKVYGVNTDKLNDGQVDIKFKALMSREIRDIQKDVQPFS